MSITELPNDGGQEERIRGVGNIVGLVRFQPRIRGPRGVAVAAQQVIVAVFARSLRRTVGRQGVAAAHVGHLIAGRIKRATRPLDVRQVHQVPRVGDIENGSAVGLALAVQPVDRRAGMMSHIGDEAVALADDERLVS